MPGTHSLARKGLTYSYRRRVPGDLRGVVKMREIVRRLRTSRFAEARKRATLLDASVYHLSG